MSAATPCVLHAGSMQVSDLMPPTSLCRAVLLDQAAAAGPYLACPLLSCTQHTGLLAQGPHGQKRICVGGQGGRWSVCETVTCPPALQSSQVH